MCVGQVSFLRIEDADLVSPIFPEIPHDVVNIGDLLWEAELDEEEEYPENEIHPYDAWENELDSLLEEDETVEELILEMNAQTLHSIEDVPPAVLVEQWRQLDELKMSDPERMNLIREWAAEWPRELTEMDSFLFPNGLETKI